MKTLTLLAALAAAAMLIVTPAFAQGTKAQCQPSASAATGATAPKAKAPEKIEGQVTNVDQKNGKITVKAPDGTTHEFNGSAETLREYKKGDHIEMTLRSEPC
jgi:Cu/Ag efflux protein CusF